MLKRNHRYMLADRISLALRERLGIERRPHGVGLPHEKFMKDGQVVQLRAVWTGEMRPPRKGEWYLSGATIAAYQAPNDLTTPYHIARVQAYSRTVSERWAVV